MHKKISIPKSGWKSEIIVGDLVYHILYGKEWVGILLDIIEETQGLSAPNEIGLVYLQPNREHKDYFKKCLTRHRINVNMGYVSMHWLWRLEEVRK